jgi:hypothetical protein
MPVSSPTLGRCLNLAPAPDGLFGDGEPKTGVWDSFAPVWGEIVKSGEASQFDEITYRQMLDDLQRRNLCVYMDNDHKTARLGWTTDEVEALAYYCAIQVNRDGQLFGLVKLAGHTCCDGNPLASASLPNGMAGYRCRVTPNGRAKLPNYQALSIQFDPEGFTENGAPVGQILICVSATNGPHIPGAGPTAGQFSAGRSALNMPTATDPKKPDETILALTPELDELRKALGLPDGSSMEAIHGAALAVVKAAGIHAEPDGDEKIDEAEMASGYEEEAKRLEEGGDKEFRKLEEGGAPEKKDGEMGKKYARAFRRIVAVAGAQRRGLGIVATQLGCKAGPKAVGKAVMTFAAGRSNDSNKVFAMEQRIVAMESAQAAKDAIFAAAAKDEREFAIKQVLNAAGPTNAAIYSGKVGSRQFSAAFGDGRITSAKAGQLYEQAIKLGASAEDVAQWLPNAATLTFTAGGSPHGAPKAGAQGESLRGGDQSDAIGKFRDQYKKDTGKTLLYRVAGAILSEQFTAGNISNVDYAAAKAKADRCDTSSFVKEVK